MLYSRHSWVRAALQKCEEDRQFMETFNPEAWYSVDLSRIGRYDLQSTYVSLNYDDETRDFVESSIRLSNNIAAQFCYSLVSFFLQHVLSKTSLNGLLGRGSMFVFSSGHLHKLLSNQRASDVFGCGSYCSNGQDFRKLVFLDIGAGDGKVTEKFKTFNAEIHATEISSFMQWRLQRNGIRVIDLDEWKTNLHVPYNLISLLNVLDRHSKPITLLRELQERLLKVDNAVLVLAVVLPFSQFVEYTKNHLPEEPITIYGKTFEEQVAAFVTNVLEPAQFVVVSWSRVPYLCEGDMHKSLYTLSDAIFILKPV